jgi:hypothetical protein
MITFFGALIRISFQVFRLKRAILSEDVLLKKLCGAPHKRRKTTYLCGLHHHYYRQAA